MSAIPKIFPSFLSNVDRTCMASHNASSSHTVGSKHLLHDIRKLQRKTKTRVSPENYLGCMITSVKAGAKVRELVERGLGWGAWKLHEAVKNLTYKKIRESLEELIKCPYTYQLGSLFNPNTIARYICISIPPIRHHNLFLQPTYLLLINQFSANTSA